MGAGAQFEEAGLMGRRSMEEEEARKSWEGLGENKAFLGVMAYLAAGGGFPKFRCCVSFFFFFFFFFLEGTFCNMPEAQTGGR